MAVSDELKVIIQAEVDRAVREIQNLNQTTQRSTQSFQSMFRQLARGAAAFIGVTASISTLNRAVRQSLEDWANLERAQVQLQSAIAATGREADISFYALQEYAGQLQSVGIFGADATMGAMALLQGMTNLDQQGLQRVTPAIQDFAAAMGIELQQAARMFAGEIEGTSSALRRYGIALDPTLDETERLEALVRQVDERFGGMNQTMAESSAGTFRRLNNELSDMRARGGQALTEFAAPFASWLADVVSRSNAAAEAVRNVNNVLAGHTADVTGAQAAYEFQLEVVQQAEERLADVQGRRGQFAQDIAQAAEQELSRQRERLALLEEELAAVEQRAAEERRLAEERRQQAEEEARLQREREERERINQVAAEARVRITRDYLSRIEELEADSLGMIEIQRRRALEAAAEDYVRSGEEIELINQYFDRRRLQEIERQAEAEAEIRRREQEALAREGEALADSLRTPYEIYSDSIERLNELKAAGAISTETYTRAVERYKEALEDANRSVEDSNVRGAIFFDTVRDLHDELERGEVTVTRWATDMVAATQQAVSPMLSIWSGYHDERHRQERELHRAMIANMRNETREMEREHREQLRLKQQMGEDTVMFEEQHRQEMLELEHERAVAEHDLAKREFERDKQARRNAAIQAGAQAIVQTFAQLGWPAGVAGAAVVAGITAKQVATIQSQSFPGFARGGEFTTSGPQLIMVGDNPGGRERVRIDPQPDNRRPEQSIVININGAIGGREQVVRWVHEGLERASKRGVVRASA